MLWEMSCVLIFLLARLSSGGAFIIAPSVNALSDATPFLGLRRSGRRSIKMSSHLHYVSPLKEVPTHPDESFRQRWEEVIYSEQDRICEAIAAVDGTAFKEDSWQRGDKGGGGRTRVLQGGKVFEKGGVNVSVVYGKLPPSAAQQMTSRGHKDVAGDVPLKFYAAGLSLVIHPHNPMAPTVHANYRFFQLFNADTGEPITWWFGGGSDLTPSYLVEEDAVHFHQTLKDACDKHDPTYYARFKKWCDEYFLLQHRGETRGVGGIFFDDLNESGDPEKSLAFARDALHCFVDGYVPLVERHKDDPYTDEQKAWQQLRRGRYVEFNLLFDRGTKFGLQTPNSRIESILMSLPLTARWEYQHIPADDSWEGRTLAVLKKPVDWIPLQGTQEEKEQRELTTAAS